MGVRLRVFIITFAVVASAALGLAAERDAHAHQTSVSRSIVTLSKDKRRITYKLSFDTRDMQEALKVLSNKDPKGSKPTPANVFALLQKRILVKTNRQCTTELIKTANLDAEDATAEVLWAIDCNGEILDLTVDYQLFYNIDKAHTSVLSPRQGDKKLRPYLFKKGGKPYRWNATNWLLFVRFGVEHIAFGYDHVLFLMGLLLVVLLGRGGHAWIIRDPKAAAKYTATIVTSFTVAHSLTLITAALGWFTLPSRFVESMIALSIIYVGIENIIYPHTRWRPVITFIFGLLHGMGFASSLADLLPPEQIIMPLLMFNVGVEIGQLLIVLAVLPIFALLARQIGAERYRRWVVPSGSIGVALFGLFWFIERAFAL